MNRQKKNKYQETLKKEDVIDIFFIIMVAIYAIATAYQITFIQSTNAIIRDLGNKALGLLAISLAGVVLTLLLAHHKIQIIHFKNIGRARLGKNEELILVFLQDKGCMFAQHIYNSLSKEHDMDQSFFTHSLRVLFNEGYINRHKEEYQGKELFKYCKQKRLSLIRKDEAFGEDFYKYFIWGLIIQIGFGFFFGIASGSVFDLTFQWNLNSLLLTVNAGVAEELFFSLFLTAFLLSFCKTRLHIFIAGLVNVFGFAAFHIMIYGTQPEAGFYIVFLRTLYFLLYYKTRRASIPILLHCANNFTSSLFLISIIFI